MNSITVCLRGGLNRFLNLPPEVNLNRPEGERVSALLAHLKLKKSMVAVILQNGERAGIEEEVLEGAVIELYPLFGGG